MEETKKSQGYFIDGDTVQADPTAGLTYAFDLIERERIEQHKKFGTQNLSPVEWIALLTEELGEVSREALEYQWKYPVDGNSPNAEEQLMRLQNYKKELVQLAAVAVQALQSLERNEWEQMCVETKAAATSSIGEQASDNVREHIREQIRKVSDPRTWLGTMMEGAIIIDIDIRDWEQKSEKLEKPPLGLKPQYIAKEHRLEEIKAAMRRYMEADKIIPEEWFTEYFDLSMELLNSKNE